jgi:hypothetical protein
LLVDRAEFLKGREELRISLENVTVLNLDKGSRAILMATTSESELAVTEGESAVRVDASTPPLAASAGDGEFLKALGELPEGVGTDGAEILRRVRSEFPGALQQYPARKFIEDSR